MMTPGVTTVTEDTSAHEITHLMYAKGIKRVPVLRDGKLVGIVARSDLVRALAQKLQERPEAHSAGFETINEAPRHRREESPR